MVAPRSAPLLLIGMCALGVAACDWRDFDELQDQTPVLAVGAPSNFGSDDFGRVVLPISMLPAGASGARYVVSAQGAPALAIVDVSATGATTAQNVSSSALSALAPVASVAEVPGSSQVLLGAPGSPGSAGAVAVLTMGATNDVRTFDAASAAERFGLGVAAGQLAGGDAPDFVVASASDLTVFLDGDPGKGVAADPMACPIAIPAPPALAPRDQVRRAVLVTSLMGDPAARQIVLGTQTAGDQGAVDVFTVDATTGLATCAFAYRNADARFGQSLAVGDFDADGQPDLLVGSPPSHAFWIKGPLTATSPVQPVTLAPGVGELGYSVTALDADGLPGDEAFVGNPDATVGDDMLAGEVRIVSGAALDHELAPLRRHDPASADAFGIDLAALPFSRPIDTKSPSPPLPPLLLVGSGTHAFTYFKLLPNSVDLRTF